MALTEASCPWLFPVIVPGRIYASLSGRLHNVPWGNTPHLFSVPLVQKARLRPQAPRMGKIPRPGQSETSIPCERGGFTDGHVSAEPMGVFPGTCVGAIRKRVSLPLGLSVARTVVGLDHQRPSLPL